MKIIYIFAAIIYFFKGMSIVTKISKAFQEAIASLYQQNIPVGADSIQKTRKDFEGDITLVVFPVTKVSRKSPEITAAEIAAYLKQHVPEIEDFNIIKGFLNLTIANNYWIDFILTNKSTDKFGFINATDTQPVVIEYSSPNTNKPLHLGHIRNNLLGFSVAEILKASGKNVVKVNLINDRGIHICKSMLAYQRWGNNETPESSGLKGDHLIGKYYVLFDKHHKEQIKELISAGVNEEEAARQTTLIKEAQQMLQLWESGDEEIIALWKKLNSWAYSGFDETYNRLGITFDHIDYESQTYKLGKDIVEQGLAKQAFYKKTDNSVWIDLSAEGLDEKLLLRSDGTSVYITQDLGTAVMRYEKYKPQQLIYVVGNEQNYHFDVLKKALKKADFHCAEIMHHLSYGMVELPSGKMKSREGTVVDADDLMDEMFNNAEKITKELGKIEGFSKNEADNLFKMISLGALKYFILKVEPSKNMLFNPTESIDFTGNTGPFIQYTYARIQSLKRKADLAFLTQQAKSIENTVILHKKEKEIIKLIHEFPDLLQQAAKTLSPALIANYVYELAKTFNQFYQELPILKEEEEQLAKFRLQLSLFAGQTIKNAMQLLGIQVPEKM